MDAAPKKRAPGGGLKAQDGATVFVRRNVMLDAESARILEQIGGNNLSLGVREAARRLREHGDIGSFSEQRHALRQSPKSDEDKALTRR